MVVLTPNRVDILSPPFVDAVVHIIASNVEATNAANKSETPSESIRNIVTAVDGLRTDATQWPKVPDVEVSAKA